MAVVEIKVLPIGTDEASISTYVADCYRVVQNAQNLAHELTPTATIVQGDLEQALNVIRQMHEVPFHRGVNRVVTTITIDDRTDKPHDMEEMVESVLDEV